MGLEGFGLVIETTTSLTHPTKMTGIASKLGFLSTGVDKGFGLLAAAETGSIH